ncbi:hypothetical protein B0H14DRAFT_3175183 [Mycena olivaceomarginata]|nr:hypothetical protein B0H14DRAFT_3175183 [Mycena olivaceomarginata]
MPEKRAVDAHSSLKENWGRVVGRGDREGALDRRQSWWKPRNVTLVTPGNAAEASERALDGRLTCTFSESWPSVICAPRLRAILRRAEFFQTISHTRGGPNYHAHTKKALKTANFAGYSTCEAINKPTNIWPVCFIEAQRIEGHIAGGKVAKKKKDNGHRTTAGNEDQAGNGGERASTGAAGNEHTGSGHRACMGRVLRSQAGEEAAEIEHGAPATSVTSAKGRGSSAQAAGNEYTGSGHRAHGGRPSSAYGAGIVGTGGRRAHRRCMGRGLSTRAAGNEHGQRVTSTQATAIEPVGDGYRACMEWISWAWAGRVTSAQAADSEPKWPPAVTMRAPTAGEIAAQAAADVATPTPAAAAARMTRVGPGTRPRAATTRAPVAPSAFRTGAGALRTGPGGVDAGGSRPPTAVGGRRMVAAGIDLIDVKLGADTGKGPTGEEEEFLFDV